MNELLAELKLAQTDSRISNFNDGYGQGEATRTVLSDDEQRQLRKEMLIQNSNRTTNNRPTDRATGTANGATPANGTNGKIPRITPPPDHPDVSVG